MVYMENQIQPLIDAGGALDTQEEKNYNLTLNTLDLPTVAARTGVCDVKLAVGDR